MKARDGMLFLLTPLLQKAILVLFFGVTGCGIAFSQTPIITSHSPVQGVYATGTPITFTGTDIYEDPDVTPNCDSITMLNTGTGLTYKFLRYRASNMTGDPNYTGTSGGTDVVNWVIPASLPCGNYNLRFYDNEDCDGTSDYSAPLNINIKDSSFANYAIPGGVFCANGSNPPLPTVTPGDNGTFTDMGTGNIIANPNTGELMLHSGNIGMTHTIRFLTSGTPASCKDSTFFTITIDSVRVQTLGYVGGNQFCQGPDTMQVLPTFDGTGGTFSSFPAMSPTAFSTSTGAIDLNVAPAGSYAITFTPPGSACEMPYTISVQVDSLVAAVYNYDPIYCHGYSLTGPASVGFLPPGGYFREVGGPGNLIFTDSLSGEIDVDSTLPGTYTIEYVVSGGCSNLTTDVITVQAPPNPFFTIQPTVCSNVATLAPSFIATPGGTFIHTGPNIDFADSSLGIINVPGSSLGGPFTIFHLVQAGVCQDTAEAHITITTAPTADVEYLNSPYCRKEPNPSPVFLSGTSGGDFSMSPPGTIVDTTGLINLLGTAPNTYTIFYNIMASGCTTFIPVDTVTILAMPETRFNIADTTLCQGSGNYPIDTILSAGAASSVFSMTNAQYVNFPGAIVGNNSINTNVLPAGGPFRIVRDVDDFSCKDSLIRFVWILELEDPNFVYAPDTFCQNDRNPVPLILGDGGGTFVELGATATDSLALDQLTGLINLGISTPGPHTVQYTTGGPCPQTDTFQVIVTSSTEPIFSYLVNSFCETDSSIISPNTFPAPPYHFTCSDTGLALDTITGAFDIAASDTGTYNVTLVLDSIGGNCPITKVAVVEILAYNSSSIVFDPVVCATDSFLQIQFDTTLAGVFFAPSGLVWQDRDTGLVAVYATIPGTYVIRYEVNGVCAEKFSDTLTVEAPTFPDFDLFPPGQREFCISDDTTFATADTVGIYSWIDVQTPTDTTSLLMNPITGGINLAGSQSGTYDITFTTSTACAGDTTKRIRIFPNPANALMLLEPNDSICEGVPLTVTGSGASYFEIRKNGVEVSNATSFILDSLVDNDEIEIVFITQQLCRDSTDTIITVLPRPDGIPIVASPTITGNEGIFFEMGTNVDLTSFTWTLEGMGDVTFSQTSDSIAPILTTERGQIRETATLGNGYDPARATFYVVPLSYGCYGDTDRVEININPNNAPIFIPDVFTPNGDEWNETWLIQWNNDIRPEEYTILVYNRSGGIVYTMNGLSEDWTGDNLPDGVYWWHLLHGQDNTVTKGAVTIRRR